MSDRKIELVIDPLGRPRIDAIGFQGQGCADATKAIEQALSSGEGGMDRVYKDSWNEHEAVTHEVEAHE